jgi:hypothetical protein
VFTAVFLGLRICRAFLKLFNITIESVCSRHGFKLSFGRMVGMDALAKGMYFLATDGSAARETQGLSANQIPH